MRPNQQSVAFRTSAGITVPAVTADQMREVDRIAVREFGLGVLSSPRRGLFGRTSSRSSASA